MDDLVRLISEDAIEDRIDKMAVEIVNRGYKSPVILIGLLKGSVVFLADLMRAIGRHSGCMDIDFMMLSSYGDGRESSGVIEVLQKVMLDVSGKTVLLVDDIADTGYTLSAAKNMMRDKGAGEVVTCVLLDKPTRRKVDLTPDYTGFTIGDKFVVGYGMDDGGRHRCLPYIAVVTKY